MRPQYYDPGLPIVLAADASAYGIGAVISHKLLDRSEQPVAYASRTLSKSEHNYAQVEMAALSLVSGIKKLHTYLYGRHSTLLTPLLSILGPKHGIPPLVAARMLRWALLLSAYTYDIQFQPTKQQANAEGLSRFTSCRCDSCGKLKRARSLQFETAGTMTALEVSKETRADPILSKLLVHLRTNWPQPVPDNTIPFWR